MRNLILILACFFSVCYNANAQPAGKVDFKITDGEQKPLDGIFVQLVKAGDSAMVQYTVSGQDGGVKFTGVKDGKYRIYISQTGYDNYFSPGITIDGAHEEVDMPDINLQSKTLNEVTVVAKTPVIQHYADKTVVNVQESPLSSQGSVMDVIQRSPGVMVDQNDNISLQGKANVLVMIDGRITPMSAGDLANMLRGMPAESVEKIEFITNPSAKYDANGTAGIINIILKKDKHIGMNATITGGYSQGIYPKSNDGFSFNYRTKKFNIFGDYNYSYRGWVNMLDLQSNFYNNSLLSSSTQQHENLVIPFINHSARIGTDFFASDKTTFGFIADGGLNKFNSTTSTTTYIYDSANNAQSYNVTGSTSPSNTYNAALNLNMKHKFDSAGRELLLNADYANYSTTAYQNITTHYYNLDNTEASAPAYFYGSLPGALDIYSFKADYDGQLGKNGTLETGIKTSYVKTGNTVNIYDGMTDAAPLDTTQSNHFIYSENINAAYATYSRNIHKGSIQLGVRAEQTIAGGNQVTTGQTFSRNFVQLFPNVSFNDSLSANNQLGLSVTRRIDRPTYNQLNPFRIYINPTFYLQGNPYLLPQNAYSFQLSDVYKQNYSVTLTYTHTQNAITTVIEPLPGEVNMVQQTEENLSSSDYYGIDFSASCQFTKWWSTTSSIDAFDSHYNANLASSPINTNRFLWVANTDNSITLSKKLTADVNAYYQSGADLGYLYIKSQWALSAGIQMRVFDKRGTIKLNASDIFWTELTNAVTTFSGFNQTIFVRRDTRFIGISFTYHFGGSSQSSLRSKGGDEEEKIRAGRTG